jgi:phage baseplate assembly protein W
MTGMNAKNGSRLSGIDHIRQSLSDILSTPIGSRVMRRHYGSAVPELIDQPLNGATLLRIYAATAAAVKLWEPRIQLQRVQLEKEHNGQLCLVLDWVINAQSVQIPVGVRP